MRITLRTCFTIVGQDDIHLPALIMSIMLILSKNLIDYQSGQQLAYRQ